MLGGDPKGPQEYAARFREGEEATAPPLPQAPSPSLLLTLLLVSLTSLTD